MRCDENFRDLVGDEPGAGDVGPVNLKDRDIGESGELFCGGAGGGACLCDEIVRGEGVGGLLSEF